MLFGSSGIRRPYDQELLLLALKVGSTLGTSAAEVVVGRDTRLTSHLLLESLVSGLLGAGVDVYDGGVAPTPTIAYFTRFTDAGCVVTASHNPEEYNGLKLFNPDGTSFTRSQQDALTKKIEKITWAPWEEQGDLAPVDALLPHTTAILDRVECSSPLRVIVDCGNGSGSVVTPNLLSQLGITVIPINCNSEGRFARSPEPTRESLSYLGEMVRQQGADCAIAHDGDADRMVAFDGKGRLISGDHLLMLFTQYLGCKRVVTTVDTSMAIEAITEVHRTPVGDTYVSEHLKEWGDFGGEQSGTWVFPSLSLCPDGIYAAALLCEIASEWNLASEVDALPHFALFRESIPHDAAAAVLTSLGAPTPTDGIRVTVDDGWYLIRASGTEPKIRITVEGETEQAAKRLMVHAKELVTKVAQNITR